MFAGGVFYWLRAPRNSADVRHDEWILAFARLLLSAGCLAAVIYAKKTDFVQYYEAFSLSYFVYSLLVILGLRLRPHPHPLFYIGIHCIDILWVVNLVILIHSEKIDGGKVRPGLFQDSANGTLGSCVRYEDAHALHLRKMAYDVGIHPGDGSEFSRPVGFFMRPRKPGGGMRFPFRGHPETQFKGS